MHYIRAALSCPATTEHSLIYMIIGGRRARRDNKGEMQRDAKWCLQSDLRCNLFHKEHEGGERERMREIHVFMCHNLELNGLTMKLSTPKCRQQPIVREDIFGGDTDAEKEMKYRTQCDT